MYNKYELLWLWYHYHTERADWVICRGVSNIDRDMAIPISIYESTASSQNEKNNRKIVETIADSKQILYEYKNTFDHLKNIYIFKIYENLDEQGQFNFIHEWVQNEKNKRFIEQQDIKKEDIITIKGW